MNIGFIGCGNMATAMIRGMISSNVVKKEEVIASDVYEPSLIKAKEELGIKITQDNKAVVKMSDVVVLAIKPQYYENIIEEIQSEANQDTIFISIAPGKTIESMEKGFSRKVKLVRTMPNTPAMVNEGMTAFCVNGEVTQEESEQVKALLDTFGKAEQVSESLMSAVVAVSGSAPAYVYLFIEALADGAVREGMSRTLAYTFAAQTVLGSAKMVLDTNLHPGVLKDMVCSPAGTTIEAVSVLEEEGFRQAVLKAMKACADKSSVM